MTQRSSAPARALALAALIGGVLLLVAVIVTSVGDGGEEGRSGDAPAGQVKQGGGGEEEEAPKAYVVQNGDTLTSIANETGVPVSRIEELNPGVDPQILVSGEKLKLR